VTQFSVDTSVLVPALVSWHPAHQHVRDLLMDVTVIPAHVLLECYSVLTRLPAPHRMSAGDAAAAVGALPWRALVLPGRAHRRLVSTLGSGGATGGAVYDALVAATASHHGVVLLTRDRRARATYDLVGVEYVLV
jgi:predicted nucleic acid-binding protein